MIKTAFFLIFAAWLTLVCADEAAPGETAPEETAPEETAPGETALSPEALRERYRDAEPAERAEILRELHAQRAAAVQARFGTEGAPLTPEEREAAAAVLREEWRAVQTARKEAVQARQAIHRAMREAMLRHRFDDNADGVLSDGERRRAEAVLNRELNTYQDNRSGGAGRGADRE